MLSLVTLLCFVWLPCLLALNWFSCLLLFWYWLRFWDYVIVGCCCCGLVVYLLDARMFGLFGGICLFVAVCLFLLMCLDYLLVVLLLLVRCLYLIVLFDYCFVFMVMRFNYLLYVLVYSCWYCILFVFLGSSVFVDFSFAWLLLLEVGFDWLLVICLLVKFAWFGLKFVIVVVVMFVLI